MATPENHAASTPKTTSAAPKASARPVEFIEFGLALELLMESHPVFEEAVKAALERDMGEFLFELPHSARTDGKGRMAAVRLAYAGSETPRLAFVFLSDDAMETRVEAAEGQPEHLRNFARSFVDVLEKFATH